MILKSYFTFFKVGQGAFYGGRILDVFNQKIYTIVYDCGTRSKGSKELIKESISIFGNCEYKWDYSWMKTDGSLDNIDLLFISHLDIDHVSGIESLLKTFNVKKIIMP